MARYTFQFGELILDAMGGDIAQFFNDSPFLSAGQKQDMGSLISVDGSFMPQAEADHWLSSFGMKFNENTGMLDPLPTADEREADMMEAYFRQGGAGKMLQAGAYGLEAAIDMDLPGHSKQSGTDRLGAATAGEMAAHMADRNARAAARKSTSGGRRRGPSSSTKGNFGSTTKSHYDSFGNPNSMELPGMNSIGF